MQIYRNPKTVFPRPLECTEDVLPTRAGQEWLAFPHVNGPPGNGYSDPVQPSACYLCEILLGLDGNRAEEACESVRTNEGGQDVLNSEFQNGLTLTKKVS